MNGWTDEAQFEKLFDIIADIRDKYPRTSDDAPSEEIAEAIQQAGFIIPTVTDNWVEVGALAIKDYDDNQPSGAFDVREDNIGKARAVLGATIGAERSDA